MKKPKGGAPICPRCETDKTAQMRQGKEHGKVIWSVWHCHHCAFTWRDSEPAASIDPAQRPAWAQLKGVDLNTLRSVIPPATAR
jgi:C4-type Zn-finger protein